MTGYPAKANHCHVPTRAMARPHPCAFGNCLAFSPRMPDAKRPLKLGQRADTMVTCVAFHPLEDLSPLVLATALVLARSELPTARKPCLVGPAKDRSRHAWNRPVACLAFGSQAGDCGVIEHCWQCNKPPRYDQTAPGATAMDAGQATPILAMTPLTRLRNDESFKA